jgi:hypothetical protein
MCSWGKTCIPSILPFFFLNIYDSVLQDLKLWNCDISIFIP